MNNSWVESKKFFDYLKRIAVALENLSQNVCMLPTTRERGFLARIKSIDRAEDFLEANGFLRPKK